MIKWFLSLRLVPVLALVAFVLAIVFAILSFTVLAGFAILASVLALTGIGLAILS